MEGESDMSLPSTTAPVPGSDEQMPKLEELQAICNLSTEEINVKIEPLDPEYLDNDSVSYEEEEACPESIVIKAEPFLFDNEEGECGTSVKAETPKKRKIKKEENSDDEEDEDYIPQKKLIAKPKAEPGTYRNRSQRKKRPTTKNLHSYNALTNIEVVSISEVERREEHKANLMKKCNYVYRCDDCALGFISKRAFEKHMESHTERPGFLECDICHTYLKSDEMLYQHKLRHYRRYRCLLCTDVTYYKDRETVACHIKTVHEEDRFLCEYCEKSFKRPAYLKNHVEQHHTKPVNLKCPECGQLFHQRNWFRWHLRKHEDAEEKQPPPSQAYICNLCFQRFRVRKDLADHVTRAHAGLEYTMPETKRKAKYTCPLCRQRFYIKKELTDHMEDKHAGLQYFLPEPKLKEKIESVCEPCDRVFSSKELLNHHNRRMHRDRTKNYQCDYCKRFYLTKSEVRSHIEWSHTRNATSGYLCHCGRQFRAPGLLRKHERKVHGGEPPPPRDKACPECGKRFASEQAVRRHMKGHLGLKFPCPECSEQFCSPQYARTHYQLRHLCMTRAEIRASKIANKIANGVMMKEEAEELKADKKCPECGKAFTTMQAVRRHQKSHSGVKYPCPECDDQFCSATYAKIHYQLRHLQMTRAEIKANTQANKKSYVDVRSEEHMKPVTEVEVLVELKEGEDAGDPLA